MHYRQFSKVFFCVCLCALLCGCKGVWVVAYKLKSKELTAKSIGSLISSLFYVFFLSFLLMLWWPMLCHYINSFIKNVCYHGTYLQGSNLLFCKVERCIVRISMNRFKVGCVWWVRLRYPGHLEVFPVAWTKASLRGSTSCGFYPSICHNILLTWPPSYYPSRSLYNLSRDI